MSATTVILRGVVKSDGTLELERPLELPPGPVEVTVKALEPAPAKERESTLAVLQRIWAEREALGMRGRTKEEIDADVQELRDELEEHITAIERLQEDARKQREGPSC